MLLYPILEWYFSFAIGLPTIVWGIVIVGLLLLGYIGFRELRYVIAVILGSPIGFYLLCYICKAGQEIPVLGIACIAIRVAVDISIVVGVVMLVSFMRCKK